MSDRSIVVPPTYDPVDRYRAESEKSGNGIDVTIVDTATCGVVASYHRNYPYLLRTFHPFRQLGEGGQWREYALVSDNYWKTSVLDLVTGEMVATEGGTVSEDELTQRLEAGVSPEVVERLRQDYVPGAGFCPQEFRVFDFNEFFDAEVLPSPEEFDLVRGMWALVAGCVWGDDSTMKVRYVDLSRIGDGVVRVDERFGYVELGADLGNANLYTETGKIDLPVQGFFDVRNGRGRLFSTMYE